MSTTTAADARIRADHPFAQHLRRAAEAEQASAHSLWTPQDGPLPSLYLSHGAPMLFEMTHWMTQLHTWARALPKPKSHPHRFGPLGVRTVEHQQQPTHRPRLRLQRFRTDVVPDAVRHPHRH